MLNRLRTGAAALVVSAAISGVALIGSAGAAVAAVPATPVAAAHGELTVSNGSHSVLINGHWVNFGVTVRDLAWSPDGSKAVFIDGSGNLVTANPNGSGRVVVAVNPGRQTWSHPTFEVVHGNSTDGIPSRDNIIFTVDAKGVDQLDYVSATAHHGKPQLLPLGSESGDDTVAPPMTGNSWANSAGTFGTAVYENTNGYVYFRDDYTRQQGGTLARGSEPSLSPVADVEDVVFVRSVAGHDHLLVENVVTGTVKDLTPHATTDYTEPTWSTDGSTIAARTPTGIVTLAANGSGQPVRSTTTVGLPAWRA
ncbi:PD40 domain-containing protein [Streptacidiphilus sp. P02-A3a]|uniref:PD40 domain-containing protein n=1 Tax=Streptacidiphilus sp. P02-A3a TaxID=2704468 RepID=UPI0015FBE483|nr:PD40 domain-containing protein [Streptacidiphilus sp. P02-A3a]QMU67023.1 hypothetical protein GXP74_01150 [Streptacidiphilus sp. P02-A3a]